jgi:putative redox protein
MATETVRIDWIRDRLFLMRDRSGFPIVMTQPSGVNAADLLPLSIIGCSIWDIVIILQKQRQQLNGVQVTAESLREEEPPWRFRKIHIRYSFTGRDLQADLIQRAIELTENKYCSTYATLRQVVDLTSEYEIRNGIAGSFQ